MTQFPFSNPVQTVKANWFVRLLWRLCLDVSLSVFTCIKHNPMKVHILMRAIFQTRRSRTQQLREFSCLRVNLHILTKPETYATRGQKAPWRGWPDALFFLDSFPAPIPAPSKEINALLSLSPCLRLFCFFGSSTPPFDDSTCSHSHGQQWKMRT